VSLPLPKELGQVGKEAEILNGLHALSTGLNRIPACKRKDALKVALTEMLDYTPEDLLTLSTLKETLGKGQTFMRQLQEELKEKESANLKLNELYAKAQKLIESLKRPLEIEPERTRQYSDEEIEVFRLDHQRLNFRRNWQGWLIAILVCVVIVVLRVR
jgi:hypothetical protein